MSQQERVYDWFLVVRKQLGHLSKPQAWVLAAFSLGLASARRCTLSAIAEALAFVGKPDTVERRLQRFLQNGRVDWATCSRALTAWVLASLRRTDVVVLLVDETSLGERLRVMAVSLAYRGRAIPLAWWCYRPHAWPKRQVELVDTLLGWVAAGLPPQVRVLVEADRGLGTSPALLRQIQARGWSFLVRVQGTVRLRLASGHEAPFAQLVPQAGDRWRGRVQVHAFKKAGWMACWALGHWDRRQDEPWLLLTNLPEAEGSWYALRMWEEQAFRDFKSTGWQWQRSRVWDPDRANRLWLVMALAYVWMLSIGTQVLRSPALRKLVTRGRGWRRSVFQIGLRYLRRCLALGQHLLYQLLFIPHLPLLRKSVVQ